jgi:hypothetical protein
MRDRARTVLAVLTSLLLAAVVAGSPAQAAGAKQVVQAHHRHTTRHGGTARPDVISAPVSQSDAEQPETGAPTDNPSEPDAARSSEAPGDPAERAFTSTAGADVESPEPGSAEQPSSADEAQPDDALSDQSSDAVQAPAPASQTVTQLADWAISSGDTGGLPFLIVDKLAAEAFVYDPSGQLLSSAPALLGSALGDDTAPGVGDKELSKIPLEERTTPAGRFIANIGPAVGFRSVLWVDFPTATSLHAVITNYPAERRLERLKSPNPDDRRITHGCINVPPGFYGIVRKTFVDTKGVVYILPDTKSVEEVFPTFADGRTVGRARAASEDSLSLH